MKRLLLTPLFLFQATLAKATSPDFCAGALSSKHEIQIQLAREAGLRYLDRAEPGITRKKADVGFTYFDSQGNVIKDATVLERIQALKIPPAYENVWISSDPKTHLQARATDSRGRLQYRYHEIWDNEVLKISKFERMKKFGESLPLLHQAVAQDLAKNIPDEKTRLAAVTRLLEIAGIRIGSDRYVEENGSYGLTTLEVQHLAIKEGAIRFQFIGKEHISHDITVKDPELALAIEKMIKGKPATEKVFSVDAAEVNSYIKTISGGSFSAKDFRTWVGTVTAAKKLFEIGPGKSEKEIKAAELAAATATSERLHNTPSVARESYIHPKIFEAYEKGELAPVFSKIESDARHSQEEKAVLSLLKNADQ